MRRWQDLKILGLKNHRRGGYCKSLRNWSQDPAVAEPTKIWNTKRTKDAKQHEQQSRRQITAKNTKLRQPTGYNSRPRDLWARSNGNTRALHEVYHATSRQNDELMEVELHGDSKNIVTIAEIRLIVFRPTVQNHCLWMILSTCWGCKGCTSATSFLPPSTHPLPYITPCYGTYDRLTVILYLKYDDDKTGSQTPSMYLGAISEGRRWH